jgi:Tol biopolymer transport system component
MRGVAAAAACVAFALAASSALAAKGDTIFVSRGPGANGTAANNSSYNPVVSADGRLVAFESGGDALSPADNDLFFNDFVRDVFAGSTTLVSRATGANGAGGDSFSNDVSISASGRYVAFSSAADNLDPGDNNSVRNVYVRDLQTNTLTFISKSTADAAADDGSSNPTVSATGRYVAFVSNADNIATVPNTAIPNVFVRDLALGTTTYVAPSKIYPVEVPGPPISPDGRYVAFVTASGGVNQVYVQDRTGGGSTLVSRTNVAGDADSDLPSMSYDGRYVAFQSDADNLSTADDNNYLNVFVRDLKAATTRLVAGPVAAAPSSYPSISADGRYVAFSSGATPSNVYVRDLQANTLTLISRATGAAWAAGTADSDSPSISANGRYVVFESDADNLSAADDNNYTNIFERDVLGSAAPPPPTIDATRPRLSKLSMTHRRFRVGKPPRRGTTFRLSLSERADLTIRIDRCVKRKRGRCRRYRKAGSLIALDRPAGRSKTAFTGRIGRKPLKPGRFRATVIAVDPAGNRSRAARVLFRVLAGK